MPKKKKIPYASAKGASGMPDILAEIFGETPLPDPNLPHGGGVPSAPVAPQSPVVPQVAPPVVAPSAPPVIAPKAPIAPVVAPQVAPSVDPVYSSAPQAQQSSSMDWSGGLGDLLSALPGVIAGIATGHVGAGAAGGLAGMKMFQSQKETRRKEAREDLRYDEKMQLAKDTIALKRESAQDKSIDYKRFVINRLNGKKQSAWFNKDEKMLYTRNDEGDIVPADPNVYKEVSAGYRQEAEAYAKERKKYIGGREEREEIRLGIAQDKHRFEYGVGGRKQKEYEKLINDQVEKGGKIVKDAQIQNRWSAMKIVEGRLSGGKFAKSFASRFKPKWMLNSDEKEFLGAIDNFINIDLNTMGGKNLTENEILRVQKAWNEGKGLTTKDFMKAWGRMKSKALLDMSTTLATVNPEARKKLGEFVDFAGIEGEAKEAKMELSGSEDLEQIDDELADIEEQLAAME